MLELHRQQECSTDLFQVSEKKENHAIASNENKTCTPQAFYRNFLQNEDKGLPQQHRMKYCLSS